MGLPGTRCTIETWSSVLGDTTPVLLCTKKGVKLCKALPLGTIGRSLADQFSEDQIYSNQGFDLITGAIRHHFRSFLEAEPEVQAEVAFCQTTRAPKGTFVEYTSRISKWFQRVSSAEIEGFHHQATGQIDPRPSEASTFLQADEGTRGRQDG